MDIEGPLLQTFSLWSFTGCEKRTAEQTYQTSQLRLLQTSGRFTPNLFHMAWPWLVKTKSVELGVVDSLEYPWVFQGATGGEGGT